MEASITMSQDQFSCSVCLDLLKDPVATPCGHSYCKVCINGCWDQEDVKGVYSCPQCKETFTPRPVLRRNNMLAEVVEKLKKTELQADQCYAGPGDVECDSCTGIKCKAVKSCLVCLASYCEDHLHPHYQSPAFKKHKLVEACAELQEKICSEHDKPMDIYCRTDQSFICYLCMIDEHKGHDIVSTKAERTEKQNELKKEQMKSQQGIQEKQKKVQELKQTVDIIKAAEDDTERIFTELISSMEKKLWELKELISAQVKGDLSRAEQLQNRLELEIDDLQRRVTELEQLSHTHDDIHFLQSFPSLCVSPGCDDSPSFTLNQHVSFDGVRRSLSDLKTRVEEICEEEFNEIRPQEEGLQQSLEQPGPDLGIHYISLWGDLCAGGCPVSLIVERVLNLCIGENSGGGCHCLELCVGAHVSPWGELNGGGSPVHHIIEWGLKFCTGGHSISLWREALLCNGVWSFALEATLLALSWNGSWSSAMPCWPLERAQFSELY
ncbi:hypothetical protein QTP86_019219 [Hemibagrus guttatus]|nr:hypothetical protein QTP86_019219 [Hemibagrus guttatus]